MVHRRRESFAELVRSARLSPPDESRGSSSWPQPIKAREWVDATGVHWRMRGSELDPKEVRRVRQRPGLRVLHAYGPEPTEPSGAEREALLTRVEQYFAGNAPPMNEFRLAEFRHEHDGVMLVVEESC